ncbi:MAG: AMP-binding protein [Mycobacteriales bacterium]
MSLSPVSGQPSRVLPVGFAAGLSRFGERAALISGNGTTTYAELAERVAWAASTIGPARRLVRVELGPDVASLAAYVACLAEGHPVLLAAPGSTPDPRYPADVSVRGGAIDVHRAEAAHPLHPELALLMSTSGSTGSPKLVRLSRDNVQANAQAIAQVLAIRPCDRAVTSLPLHYCFGLSVLHSHLLSGAAMVLTDLSVAEPCFWDLAAAAGVTTLAGVPHTFALLERNGFADRELPSLRSVLQAGGRLAPDKVRHWAQVGQRHGWDLHVMYGQTEATARMAVLPPDLAQTHPEYIGRAIPGGAFALEPCPEADEPDVGELVYTGPNVMFGYAEDSEDLALGRTVQELRTGDLARIDDDGLVQIVGRRSRFLKVFGQRLDLEHLERQLGSGGLALHGDDDVLRVAAEAPVDTAILQQRLASLTGLPRRCIHVTVVEALPRTAAGKVDGHALRLLSTTADPVAPTSVREVVASVLSLPLDQVTQDSTFVGLGGDSLSYVEAAIHLEVLLPDLPPDWHLRRLDSLASQPTARRRGTRHGTDTSVLLRALATLLIVAHHSEVVKLLGGAHLLLGVAGYNFARFQLTPAVRRQRVRRSAAPSGGSSCRASSPSACRRCCSAGTTSHTCFSCTTSSAREGSATSGSSRSSSSSSPSRRCCWPCRRSTGLNDAPH